MSRTDCETVTVNEMARMLGLSPASAYAAIARGDLPAVRVGRRWIVPVERLRRRLDGEAA